jgi:hypothetical protein
LGMYVLILPYLRDEDPRLKAQRSTADVLLDVVRDSTPGLTITTAFSVITPPGERMLH